VIIIKLLTLMYLLSTEQQQEIGSV